MDILDLPANLHFKNGKAFPPNVVFMGYFFLGLSPLVAVGNPYIGAGLLLLGAFLSFTGNHVVLDIESGTFRDYTAYLGFIKVGKTIDYRKYSVLTLVPVRQTTTTYGRSTLAATQTDYLFALCLLTANFRGKRELTRLKQKSEGESLAKELAHRLGLEYFEYDPKVIREKMLNR